MKSESEMRTEMMPFFEKINADVHTCAFCDRAVNPYQSGARVFTNIAQEIPHRSFCSHKHMLAWITHVQEEKG